MFRKARIVLGFACLGLCAGLAAADAAFPLVLTRAQTLSSELRARDGELLRPFLSADHAWRLKTSVHDVDPRYLSILKTYEDQRFDAHPGIDPAAVFRAFVQYVSSGRVVSGASTLTMQTARLLEPGQKRGILTKLRQAARAVQLELRYSKDKILGLYLTLAPFGGNLEGVRAASLAYFGKEPRHLTLSESALLVALPQSPERFRPDRHPKRAWEARNKVLTRLRERQALPEDEALEARNGKVPPMRLAMPFTAPHLAERLTRQETTSIVVSTLDARLQQAAEEIALRESEFLSDGANLAILVVKNDTREVLIEIGGANYWGQSGQIDLAHAVRSPGSALKPFIYGLAFDDLGLHPATLMHDAPELFGDYAPDNFDGGFRGWVSARDALRMSLNVPAVMALERVGPVRFTLALRHAGARLVFPNDSAPTLPIALGGLGLSLRDLAMLYAGVANGGEMRELHEIAARKDTRPPYRMFGEASAYYLRDILRSASLPEGWAMGQGLKRGRDIGFKTGTSYGYRDAWASGFSNDYTVAVWVGRADGAPRPDRMGREDAAPILFKMFDLLPPDTRGRRAPPSNLIRAVQSGDLPQALRQFSRARSGREVEKPRIPAPSIAFPPNGAVVSLPKKQNEPIQLAATGGRAPLTWLVNGALLGSYDRYAQVHYTPDGEGFARISVVDADGRSAQSRVRFKR